MKNRILRIIEERGLSNSQFADKVGIPRSGLSHVLSGRNKPSLDYVMKILEAFPDLDPQWLIQGKQSGEHASPRNTSFEQVNKRMGEQAGKMAQEFVQVDGKKSMEIESAVENKSIPNRLDSDKKEVERIVVFYTNGTFKEYLP